MPTFTGYLRERSDDELVALLRSRPDLASPSPATLSSLAVRATSRSSLERALAGVDASVLQVLEAVVALADPGPVTAADLPAAVGATDEAGVGERHDGLEHLQHARVHAGERALEAGPAGRADREGRQGRGRR